MRKKILVVDNHPMILKLMSNLLEKEGHEVRVAEDGLSALDILKEFRPELMFVDLVMPNISGDKLCRIIRSMPEFDDLFIVVLSALAADEKVDYLAFGANACIGKGPFKEIARHVQELIDSHERGRASELAGSVMGGEQGYGFDVTQELISARRHFEIILNNMSEGIIELTPEGRVIYVNPMAAGLLARSEEKVLGELFIDFFADEQANQVRAMLARATEGPVAADDNAAVVSSGRILSLGILPVEDREGHSYIVIIQDITKHRLAQAELKKAQTLMVRQEKLASIGTLASGVAHEILNPLNIIGTIAQVIKLDESLPAALHGEIDEILLQIRRATRITNNLRRFSHSHQQAREEQPVNLNELFDRTATLLEHDFNLDNIVIERHFDPELPTVAADSDQLAQVLVNLLNNARDAMSGPEKRIVVTTRKLPSGVELTLADSGCGIPKKYIDKIFDPFFTTKDPGQGTGLGLSIVYSIIDNHGGSIQVLSEEGQGTTFIIQLPFESKPLKSVDPESLFR